MTTELSTSNELQQQLNCSPAILLYFFNDNCAPCIALRPKVEAMLSEEYPEMRQFYINAAKLPELAAANGVFASPTIIAFFEGRETFRVSKFVSIYELSEKIGRSYTMIFG